MRIAEVIGTVTLSVQHPSLKGGGFRVAIPLTLEQIESGERPVPELFVVYDELQAGVGSLIAVSEGGEAAQPFFPNPTPIDAYNAAILDAIDLKYPINDSNK